jgi:3-phosphoshikimate 1-carboxyvinyltransferase
MRKTTRTNAAHTIEIVPVAKPLVGACEVPGSKSLTNRALLLAGFAQGCSHLRGLLDSDDAFWCRDVLARLGIETTWTTPDKQVLRVEGCNNAPPIMAASLHLGDAGTLARFLPGLLAGARQGSWQLGGSPQLEQRPLAPLIAALQAMGGHIFAAAQGGLPLRVEAGGLQSTKVRLAGDVSSQFVSGVLMAAAASGQAFDIGVEGALVQPMYVAMTVRYLQSFGAQIEPRETNARWLISPSQLVGQNLHIEADASTACYFWALAAATGGSVTVRNVGSATTQADIGLLPYLQQMGCDVEQSVDATTVHGPRQLKGGFSADLQHISDQAPTLAALAALADAPVDIVGVGHIRHHESDRLAVMAKALRAVGTEVCVHATGLHVTPTMRHGAEIDPHDDHRIAMAMALVGTKTPGVRITNAGCVAKTCPRFFEMLETLGVRLYRTIAPHA